jgi:hypothetical protein
MSSEKDIISFVLTAKQVRNAEVLGSTIESLRDVAEQEGLIAEYIVVLPHPTSELVDRLRDYVSLNSVQVVVVGEGITWDQEIFAGLSRANGDYSFVFGEKVEPVLKNFPNMLKFAKFDGSDVVGARKSSSFKHQFESVRESILFKIIRKNTNGPLTKDICSELLISRKALNWILRDLSSARCMLEMFLIPGLTYTFIKSGPESQEYKLSRPEYLGLMTRYTQIPIFGLKLSFLSTALVMVLTSLNALSVKLRSINLLNQVESQVPGWTTLVLLLSFGFTAVIYGLYISLRTIIYLAREQSSKPSRVVKSAFRL